MTEVPVNEKFQIQTTLVFNKEMKTFEGKPVISSIITVLVEVAIEKHQWEPVRLLRPRHFIVCNLGFKGIDSEGARASSASVQ